jgi:hypothetical protein
MKFCGLNNFLRLQPSVRLLQPVLFLLSLLTLSSCSPDEQIRKSSVILKTGVAYTADGDYVSPGSKIILGVLASGSGAPLTYLRIERITGNDTVVQVDMGIFAGKEGFDRDFTFPRSQAEVEFWDVIVMNADRDIAKTSLRVNRGEGMAYGPINHYGPLEIGLQSNDNLPQYLDLNSGLLYHASTIGGREQDIGLVAYFYLTSGLPSPTLTCPAYTSALAYYPAMGAWPVRNSTLFDYFTSDNQLVSPAQFEAAANDSLLVSAYNPARVSGNCKFAYTGRVIPFKTQEGKYGMIRINSAAMEETGSISMEIKIQQ